MSSQKFKELAVSLMTKKDASLMEYLSLEYQPFAKKTGCKFIDNWRKWENTLRLNLGKSRALNLYNEYTGEIPPDVPEDAVYTATNLFSHEGTPLEGEMLFDRARWNVIEDLLAGSNYFDRGGVYAYFLKLLLLERHQLFNIEKGFAEYKSIYAEIIKNAQVCVFTSTEAASEVEEVSAGVASSEA